jgi:hypothetical protein
MYGLQDTVRLKSTVGPLTIARRIQDSSGRLSKEELHWNFDNDFKVVVPRDWWERIQDEYLDRTTGLQYRKALLPF